MLRKLAVLLIITLVPVGAYAHLSTGGKIDEARVATYAKSAFPEARWSLGEMEFFGPKPSVPAEQLTPAEKYILFGVRSSSMPDRGPMEPWSLQLYQFVQDYYARHHGLPAQLDEAILRANLSFPAGTDPALAAAIIDSYRNPMTDQWPRIDASDFSRGDALIRPLTQTEVDHLASRSSYWKRLLKQHKALDPETNKLTDVEITAQPFYVRIYGETKPLVEMVQVQYNIIK